MPVANPTHGLDGEDNGRFAALHFVVPLRIGRAYAPEFVIGERALRLMADAIGIDMEMPIGNGRLGPCLVGLIAHGRSP